MNITAKKGDKYKIYINNILHIAIDVNKIICYQSWIDPEKSIQYVIECYTDSGSTIMFEYDCEEKWKAVLHLLDKVL